MVPVAGRPFIEHVLDFLTDAGVNSVVMAVSYRWETLRDHIGSSYRGAAVAYSIEDEPLGTGGAILKCFRECSLQRAFVLNADTLFRVDLEGLMKAHAVANSLVTIALRKMASASRYGAVTCEAGGRITAFHEKMADPRPGLINGGIYVIERQAFELAGLPDRFSFERDFLQERIPDLKPLGVESDAYFIDIGIPEDLQRARQEIAADAAAASGVPG
jgi:D-glycero-alpha-D-manno-heptose 1-phosphate guanylyltransferase